MTEYVPTPNEPDYTIKESETVIEYCGKTVRIFHLPEENADNPWYMGLKYPGHESKTPRMRDEAPFGAFRSYIYFPTKQEAIQGAVTYLKALQTHTIRTEQAEQDAADYLRKFLPAALRPGR